MRGTVRSVPVYRFNASTYPNVTYQDAWGSLNASDEADVYAYTYERLCSGQDYVDVIADGFGEDVDLYVNASRPSIAGEDPANYSRSSTGSSTTEAIRISDADDGDLFSVMVRRATTSHVDYELEIRLDCDGVEEESSAVDRIVIT